MVCSDLAETWSARVQSQQNPPLVHSISHEAFPESDQISGESKHTSKGHENRAAVLTAVYGKVTDSSQVKSIWQGFTAFLTADLVSI